MSVPGQCILLSKYSSFLLTSSNNIYFVRSRKWSEKPQSLSLFSVLDTHDFDCSLLLNIDSSGVKMF